MGVAGKKTGFDYQISEEDKNSSSSSVDFSSEMSDSQNHSGRVESPSAAHYRQNPHIRQTLNGDFKLQSESSGMQLQIYSSSSQKELLN